MPKKCGDLLAKIPKGSPPGFIVIFGDEDFLHRETARAVRTWVLGAEPEELAQSTYQGTEVDFATVRDELFTPPFLGEKKLVTLEGGDTFVTSHRASLEAYADRPSPCGVLLLLVSSWPQTTKLAKLVEAKGLALDANGPKAWNAADWCVRWTKQRYQRTLEKTAADWLVELVGTSLGQLDQEIAKTSAFAGPDEPITAEMVQSLVAGTRTETAFRILDMILDADLSKALDLLDRQFIAGESPVGILAMITAQLRRLARAARLTEFGLATPEALRQAGIPPFAIDKARSQLNHFGRDRMETMLRQLLQADLDLKGSSSLSQRTVLERLFIELSQRRTAPC